MTVTSKSQMTLHCLLRRENNNNYTGSVSSFPPNSMGVLLLLLVCLLTSPNYSTAWLSPVTSSSTTLVSVSRVVSFDPDGERFKPYSAEIVVRPTQKRRRSTTPTATSTTALKSDRFNRDLEERSSRRAQGKGVGGEIAAGAILGGLIMGPFGKNARRRASIAVGVAAWSADSCIFLVSLISCLAFVFPCPPL
jgi:hypothetical protein